MSWALVLKKASEILVEKDYEVRLIIASLLAEGHVLIEGVPGIAKTLTAKTVAKLLNLDFKRVQMTPDLLPTDIVGGYVYDARQGSFTLKKGPVFTNVLLIDEINRGSPRTQSALLEAMQERQVSIEGQTFPLEKPFIVLATQNPIEFEGVFPLPEAQLDRFLARIESTYTSTEGLKRIIKEIDQIEEGFNALSPVMGREEVLESIKEVRKVRVDDSIYDYTVRLVEESRKHPAVKLGASPRAGIALVRLAKALAYIDSRNYVIPDDIKSAAKPVLSHRIILKPEYEISGVNSGKVIEDLLASVEVPKP
ncbi:MAG: MoxR family ATPase [Desulfurococcaceae archaeon]|jgi:MoxR-like ATPase|nr:MoxR family ATPase [Desulfurococcaceae archaeon]